MLDYWKMEDGRLCFSINKNIYSLKALYRTSYIYTDEYYIGIDEKNDKYLVYLSAKNMEIPDKKVVGEFQNELLHQSIRFAVEKETKQIRELIITRALYSAFIPEEINIAETEKEKAVNLDLDDIAKVWYDEKIETE